MAHGSEPWAPPWRQRALGLPPLVFVVYAGQHHASIGAAGEMLWLCHVAALGLGLGLIAGPTWPVRPAASWAGWGVFAWAIHAAAGP